MSTNNPGGNSPKSQEKAPLEHSAEKDISELISYKEYLERELEKVKRKLREKLQV